MHQVPSDGDLVLASPPGTGEEPASTGLSVSRRLLMRTFQGTVFVLVGLGLGHIVVLALLSLLPPDVRSFGGYFRLESALARLFPALMGVATAIAFFRAAALLQSPGPTALAIWMLYASVIEPTGMPVLLRYWRELAASSGYDGYVAYHFITGVATLVKVLGLLAAAYFMTRDIAKWKAIAAERSGERQ